ncbi:hypothetical protein V6N13_062364 [Hibiscus sabdariffa]|uniref:Uncharacterized protein n=1 Tax=Hibiscus sabdariffa TaxID=183260 RepID=A0ABR2BQH6_9ROSI
MESENLCRMEGKRGNDRGDNGGRENNIIGERERREERDGEGKGNVASERGSGDKREIEILQMGKRVRG